MELASFKQHFQDWITQQWVIIFGKKIEAKKFTWLLGPFGNVDGIGEKFVQQLAEKENLDIDSYSQNRGLLNSIDQLELPKKDLEKLPKEVVTFYEKTSHFSFDLKVNWNPFFKPFGYLLKLFFSNRIEQLNIPLKNNNEGQKMQSNIIKLNCKSSNQNKRIIWLRTFKETNQVVYSGVYETCKIPNGTACIKAIFPLPNGSATVILRPEVSENGSLILNSNGSKIGDSGFYFLLKDKNKNIWAKHIKSFKDCLVVNCNNGKINAIQTMTFYGLKVLEFEYDIKRKYD